MADVAVNTGRLPPLGELDRAPITIEVDGEHIEALEGDSVLVAVLASGWTLRQAEFGGGDRADFCLGFQIGPGVGDVMAELITTGSTSTPIEPYAIARFDQPAPIDISLLT